MEKNLLQLKDEVTKLRNRNISYEDMGVQNNFLEAEKIKNEVTDLHLKIITDINNYTKNIPKPLVENYINIIRTHLSAFNGQVNNIENLIKKGVHTPEYPGNRSNYISDFQRNETPFLTQLFNIENIFKLEKISGLINDNDQFKSRIENVKSNLFEIDSMIKDAKQKLGDISDLSLIKTLKESAGSFDKLRENHGKMEKSWFIAFCISIILIFASVILIFIIDFNGNSTTEIITHLIKKILLIGIPALLMRISLKKYNLERNLKIIYDHRATVLEQYKTFENSIGDDREAKNLFRLEIAKYIFTDPLTGYISDSQTTDLNVNPIVNIAEKLATRN